MYQECLVLTQVTYDPDLQGVCQAAMTSVDDLFPIR
jgi:hypothetical protein